jgi:hypothetical protein
MSRYGIYGLLQTRTAAISVTSTVCAQIVDDLAVETFSAPQDHLDLVFLLLGREQDGGKHHSRPPGCHTAGDERSLSMHAFHGLSFPPVRIQWMTHT